MNCQHWSLILQIEGGFVMGVGNVTTEELVFDENGRLLIDGTWEYKPPCSKSIHKVCSLSYKKRSL